MKEAERPSSISDQIKQYIINGGEIPVVDPRNVKQVQSALVSLKQNEASLRGKDMVGKWTRFGEVGRQLDALIRKTDSLISPEVEEVLEEEARRTGTHDRAAATESEYQGARIF